MDMEMLHCYLSKPGSVPVCLHHGMARLHFTPCKCRNISQPIAFPCRKSSHNPETCSFYTHKEFDRVLDFSESSFALGWVFFCYCVCFKNPFVIIFTFCFHSNKEQLYMGKEKVRGYLENAKENKRVAHTQMFSSFWPDFAIWDYGQISLTSHLRARIPLAVAFNRRQGQLVP